MTVSLAVSAPGAGSAPSTVVEPPPVHGVVVVASAPGARAIGARASADRRPLTASGANAEASPVGMLMLVTLELSTSAWLAAV